MYILDSLIGLTLLTDGSRMKHLLVSFLCLAQLYVTFGAPTEDFPSLKHLQLIPDILKEYDLAELIKLVYRAAPEICEEFLRELHEGHFIPEDTIAEQQVSTDTPVTTATRRHFTGTIPDITLPDITDTSCALCRVVVLVLKGSYLADNFENLTEKLINFCIKIAPALGMFRGEVLCRGTVNLQMPHVKNVISNPLNTIDGVCQFLNLCPLPDSQFRSVQTKRSFDFKPEPVKKRAARSAYRSAPPENALVVVQLTDIHVEEKYEWGTEVNCGLPVCCDREWGDGTARSYGEYECNIPRSTIELFLEKVKSFNPNVILFSGDVPPHSMWDETKESQTGCSRTLVDTIKETLPGYKVYPNIGNHEGYPTNLFSVREKNLTTPEFLTNFYNIWETVAGFEGSNNITIAKGGYYSKDLGGGLHLISFNTNYMYTFNWYNINNHRRTGIPQSEYVEMTNFVSGELDRIAGIGGKVILMGHHPPGGSDYIVKGSQWYREQVLKHNNTIVLQPTGHTHYDEFRMIYDYDGITPRSVVLVSPSMSSGGKRNPSMRIYYLHNETKELLDYDQYYLNLGPIIYKQSNATADELITHLYSAKSNYSMDDLSPESWHQLLQSFKQDPAKLNLHRKLRQADAQTSLGLCEERCQNNYICRLENVNYDEYKDCAISLSEIDWSQITITRPTRPPPPTINSAPSYHSITAATLFISALILSLIH